MSTIDAVIEAAKMGDVDTLKRLLADDHTLASSKKDDYPPLWWAAVYGYSGRTQKNEAAVNLLLERGADFDIFAAAYLARPDRAAQLLEADPSLVGARDPNGMTPLHHAAERGATEVAQLLIECGAEVDATDERGQTPLDYASHPGPWKPSAAVEIIELLAAGGAQIDIFLASSLGDSERVAELLQQDLSLANAMKEDGTTPLFSASRNLHLGVINLLLTHNADVDARCDDGQTPISTAVGHMWDQGGTEVINRLLEAGAVLDIYEASTLGKSERVAEILRADPSQVNEGRWGTTPIEAAADAGQVEPGRMLAEAGAEVDIFSASSFGLQGKVEQLLKDNPSLVNTRRRMGGYQPLHCAAECGHPEIVQLLIASGAEVDGQNAWGFTPLHLGALSARNRPPTESHLAACKLLIEYGADVNARDDHDRSILDIAQIGTTKPGAISGIVELLSRHVAKGSN